MPASPYTQLNRALAVTTPLGPDVLLLDGFTATEALSEPFLLRLDLLALATTPVLPERLLGQPVSVKVVPPDLPPVPRYFHGVVTRFGQTRQTKGVLGTVSLVRYFAEVRPSLWLLTRRHRSRSFTNLSVPDILAQVFFGMPVVYRLEGLYEPREYVVQYRETDFAFASRLMEEEGIFYYFLHTLTAHTLVVADSPAAHLPVPAPPLVPYKPDAHAAESAVTAWGSSREVRSTVAVLRDYSFELPTQPLEATAAPPPVAGAAMKAPLAPVYEWYDYPGGYANRFDEVGPTGAPTPMRLRGLFADNLRAAAVRAGQEAAQGVSASGAGSCRHFAAGNRFILSGHFSANGPYVLTSVEHTASQAGSFTAEGNRPLEYGNTFTCLPATVPFRPQRTTPRPRIDGVQTAVVVAPTPPLLAAVTKVAGAATVPPPPPVAPAGVTVGPPLPEVATDKYGRVKVRFHWEREGKPSCWVRVAAPWSGANWGAMHVPRIGQEVVVAFEEGDPDRPLVVGCVPNAGTLPPYALPENGTVSGTKTRSTPMGTVENFNEFRFEDKKGAEHVFLRGERDMAAVVARDEAHAVGKHSYELRPSGDHAQVVGAGGTYSIDVGGGGRLALGPDGRVLLAAAGAPLGLMALVASRGIELTVGAATITMTGESISLSAGGNVLEVSSGGVLSSSASSPPPPPLPLTMAAQMAATAAAATAPLALVAASRSPGMPPVAAGLVSAAMGVAGKAGAAASAATGVAGKAAGTTGSTAGLAGMVGTAAGMAASAAGMAGMAGGAGMTGAGGLAGTAAGLAGAAGMAGGGPGGMTGGLAGAAGGMPGGMSGAMGGAAGMAGAVGAASAAAGAAKSVAGMAPAGAAPPLLPPVNPWAFPIPAPPPPPASKAPAGASGTSGSSSSASGSSGSSGAASSKSSTSSSSSQQLAATAGEITATVLGPIIASPLAPAMTAPGVAPSTTSPPTPGATAPATGAAGKLAAPLLPPAPSPVDPIAAQVRLMKAAGEAVVRASVLPPAAQQQSGQAVQLNAAGGSGGSSGGAAAGGGASSGGSSAT